MPRPLSRFLPASLHDEAEVITFLCLTLSVAIALVSIAASQILLGATLVGAFWLKSREGWSFARWPSIAWPLLAFFCWTVMAALTSSDVWLGLNILKKFLIFLLVFLVPWLARGQGRLIWIHHAIFVVASVSSVKGLGQFILNPRRDLLHRISGFMSQWMTYSGLQMLVLVTLCAYAVTNGFWRRWWVAPLALFLGTSLILSETRSAWLGAVAGVAVVFALRLPRALGGLLVLLLALLLLNPSNIRARLQAGWNVSDVTTQGRIELVGTSLRLIRNNPWFGVGPKNVNTEALRYRGSYEFPDWLYQHMHNNFLQIAAERGIPGLLLWLWFMGQLAWNAYQVFHSTGKCVAPSTRDTDQSELLLASTAALGAWAALIVSGMFEYNFGDSEVLTLFLFLVSAPYATCNLTTKTPKHEETPRD